MGAHKILSLTDQAIVAYIISLGIGDSDSVRTGKSAAENDEKPNFVAVHSPNGRPTADFSGQWTVQTEIEIHANAAPDNGEDTDTMKATSDDLASEVFDAFLKLEVGAQSGSSLADEITAAATGAGLAYAALDVTISDVEQGMAEKAGEWVDVIKIQTICIPRTV